MARIGETTCGNLQCGCTDVALNRTAGGRLSAKCHKCGCEVWAPVGSKAHRQILAAAILDDETDRSDPAPAPAPEPAAGKAAKTKPKPAEKPEPVAAKGFNLGAL